MITDDGSTTPVSDFGFELEPNSHPASDDARAGILADPGFGRYFTDHMAHVRWTQDEGWHDRVVRPYARA